MPYPPYATVTDTAQAARDLADQIRSGVPNRALTGKAGHTIIGFLLLQTLGEPSDGFGSPFLSVSAPDLGREPEATAADCDALAELLDQRAAALSGPISGLALELLVRVAKFFILRMI